MRSEVLLLLEGFHSAAFIDKLPNPLLSSSIVSASGSAPLNQLVGVSIAFSLLEH
jgi:hypothetical protein